MAVPNSRRAWALAAALLGATAMFHGSAAVAQGRDMGCSPTVWDPCGATDEGSSTPYRQPRDTSARDAERAQRQVVIDRYNGVIEQSDAAFRAGDYREAARLSREAVTIHGPLGASKASRGALASANLYDSYADALDAGNAANASARAGDYVQAMAYAKAMIRLNPKTDTKENRAIIAGFANHLRDQQSAAEAADRRAADIAAADALARQMEARRQAAAFAQRRNDNPLKDGDPGAELLRAARISQGAAETGGLEARDAARRGFDVPEPFQGGLMFPDKSKYQQIPPSWLERQVPEALRADPDIHKAIVESRSLEGARAEKKMLVARLEKQIAESHDLLLAAKLATVENDVKRMGAEQATAKAAMKAKVLDKGLEWQEEEAPPEEPGPEPAGPPPVERQ